MKIFINAKGYNIYVGVESPTYENVETPKCKLGFQPNNITKPTYGYINKGEKGIFQRRCYEHTITSQEELNNHIDYIHYNPVKHGYVEAVSDWEYSSFYKFEDGFYNENGCDFSQVKDMNYE